LTIGDGFFTFFIAGVVENPTTPNFIKLKSSAVKMTAIHS